MWRHRTEIAWAALVLLSFPAVAAMSAGLEPVALANGARLMDAQAGVGVGGEAAVAAWAEGRPLLAVPADVLYVWMHVPLTIGALGWACVRRPEALLFANMTWSTPQVMNETRRRLRQAKLT